MAMHDMVAKRAPEAGFTVIEALVAMTILAIAAVALIGVSETQISRIDGLEVRAIAGWVAENRLAEIELAGLGSSDPASAEMLGRDWRVTTTVADTADAELKQVTISVVEAGTEGPTSVLSGFVDARGRP